MAGWESESASEGLEQHEISSVKEHDNKALGDGQVINPILQRQG